MDAFAGRLAIVLSHPVQYYSPWFQWLRQNTALEFKVFYLWNFGVTVQRDPQFGQAFQWDVDLLSGYENEFVPNLARDPGMHHFRGLNNPGLVDRLGAWKPDAILLFGYKSFSHLRVIRWARRQRVPLVFRGDSHLLGRGRPAWPQRQMLRLLYRQFSAFATVGLANRDYFRAFGVPESRLFFAPHSVDHRRFNAEAPGARAGATELRRSLGLEGKRVVLFAGKLHSGKQPVELLRAFLDVADDRHALVFVGDGELKSDLESLARTRPERHVRLLPFTNQSEMPSRYLLADLFALPSRSHYETWGLAVNEAMHLGVPCLVSDLVGCQRDLVLPGETGWVFAVGEDGGLTRALRAALETSTEELKRLGQNAMRRVSGYTYAQASAGLLAALASLPASPA